MPPRRGSKVASQHCAIRLANDRVRFPGTSLASYRYGYRGDPEG